MCDTDGGCADGAVEKSGPSSGGLAVPAAGSGARRTRVQTTSPQGGSGAAGSAARGGSPSQSNSGTQQADAGADEPRSTPRAGSAAPMMDSEPQPTVDAGQAAEPSEPEPDEPEPSEPEPSEPEPSEPDPSDPDPTGACDEQMCGPCQACGESGTCEPVTGRDDADSCSDIRSCSSRGECQHVSESHIDLGTMSEYAELTTSYAQVISFSEPASIVEIRLEVSCSEDDQTFPSAWIVEAPGGIPSNTMIAAANVIYQEPSESNTFALLELSKVIEQPATGPIAIVVNATEMSCSVRLNTEEPYPNGALFSRGAADLWLPAEGSMVFQTLSSQ
ncbi:MAG TPA: hypothetical protein VMF89_25020 [Polyangiales bacterium]|nr:hypothetical protein [Polyangiales bacterium]